MRFFDSLLTNWRLKTAEPVPRRRPSWPAAFSGSTSFSSIPGNSVCPPVKSAAGYSSVTRHMPKNSGLSQPMESRIASTSAAVGFLPSSTAVGSPEDTRNRMNVTTMIPSRIQTE